jgi:cellulose synthase (UDP-forming)
MRLFIWDNPLFKRGLPMRARFHYSTVALSYIFAGFFLPFFFCIPLWTYITGDSFFGEMITHYLLVRLFYFATMVMAIHYLCYGRAPAKQFRLLAGLFPIFLKQFFRAFFYPKNLRKPKYSANNKRKAGKDLTSKPPILALIPQLAFMTANIVLPFYAIAAETCPPRLIAANVFLSAFCLWALAGIVLASLGNKKWAEGEDPHYVYQEP